MLTRSHLLASRRRAGSLLTPSARMVAELGNPAPVVATAQLAIRRRHHLALPMPAIRRQPPHDLLEQAQGEIGRNAQKTDDAPEMNMLQRQHQRWNLG